MAKNKKEVIEITDEGIIAVNGLVADFEYLYDKIKTKIKNEWHKNLEWIKMVEPEDVIHIYHEPMFD